MGHASRSCVIRGARVVFPGERIDTGTVEIFDGLVGPASGGGPSGGAEVIEAGGRLLSPGLIDLHVHGIETFSFDAGPEALLASGPRWGRFGTTTVFPTLVPRRRPGLLKHLERIAAALPEVRGVSMPGLHLEGPFMALPGAGCEVISGDVGFLDEILAACRGRVAIMSISPDTPGILPVLERLRECAIVPFITHTRADARQTEAAIAAGARHATHFYDVFEPPVSREPGARAAGAVEALLAHPETTVDFIADGCHVDPVVIRAMVQAKGIENVCLITDANVGAGLPPGEYATPWGFPVRIGDQGGARIADPAHPMAGALAGSALTMNVGMRNLLGWLRRPPGQIWAMGTSNPARVARLKQVGGMEPGCRADLVLWNEDLTPAVTWVGGEKVYEESA